MGPDKQVCPPIVATANPPLVDHPVKLEQLLLNKAAATAVTLFDADEAVDVPDAFVAVTVNVYDDPAVSPATLIGLLDPVPVNPPALLVAV